MAKTKFPHGPRVRVKVTKEAITKAVRTHSGKCWIAESIKDAFPEARGVAVDVATTRFTDPTRGLRYVYLTPYSAQLSLLEFDEGREPEPFTFVLKNAHVTKAGGSPKVTPAIDTAAGRENAKKKAARRAATSDRVGAIGVTLQPGDTVTSIPRRIGGRRPPQLRMLRQFGVRAFRGARVVGKPNPTTGATEE